MFEIFLLCFIVSVSHVVQAEPYSWTNFPCMIFKNETKCYDEIGCLDLTCDWFHYKYRLLYHFPSDRDVINTTFFLYTDKNPCDGQILEANDYNSISNGYFNPYRLTTFIIHGFIDSSQTKWVKQMRDELLKRESQNVVLVDWSGGSRPLYKYYQAAVNTRLVGLEIAYLLRILIEQHGLHAKDVHLIGHSLGAHTAGYAAERIPGIGRITGLDPAYPYFQEMGTYVRLDPSDALFVDVIHTDVGEYSLKKFMGYGLSSTCGHIDFYPNDGKGQPGCGVLQRNLTEIHSALMNDGLYEVSRLVFACNHARAIKFFIESINGNCPFVGYRCTSFDVFLQGKCFDCNSENCAVMGYHAKSPTILPSNDTAGKYYLTTNEYSPFCHRPYRITVELAKPNNASYWVQGQLSATVRSARAIRHLKLTNDEIMRFDHGNKYHFIIFDLGDLGDKFDEVELIWLYRKELLSPTTYCVIFCNDHLYVKSISIEPAPLPLREKRNWEISHRLCASYLDSYAEIPNIGSFVFKEPCDVMTNDKNIKRINVQYLNRK